MAPAASNGVGNVWVKLWQDAGTTTNWAVDKLIAAKGRHYIYIPNVAPGKYLLKPEMLSMLSTLSLVEIH
jgi:cellulase